jgi:toxin ParE1/3/4
MKIETTSIAEADIEAAGDRIALRAPAEAVKFITKLRDRIELIGVVPHAGAPRPQWGDDIRLAPFGRYLIIYRVRHETVQILRFLHGARDIDALFADESLPE